MGINFFLSCIFPIFINRKTPSKFSNWKRTKTFTYTVLKKSTSIKKTTLLETPQNNLYNQQLNPTKHLILVATKGYAGSTPYVVTMKWTMTSTHSVLRKKNPSNIFLKKKWYILFEYFSYCLILFIQVIISKSVDFFIP